MPTTTVAAAAAAPAGNHLPRRGAKRSADVASEIFTKKIMLQIREQIGPIRAQIRGQIQPSLNGRPRNAADTTADMPDTATFSIWPLQ
jgi:hypothetical protein